jgi:hypothetical protein
MLTGCTVLWTDDAFYCSFMNLKTFDHAKVINDPNNLNIELSNYVNTPKGSIITPWGVINAE